MEDSLLVFLYRKLEVLDVFKTDIDLVSSPIILSPNGLNRRIKPKYLQTKMLGIDRILNFLDFLDKNLFLNRPFKTIKSINRESLPNDLFALFSNVGCLDSYDLVVRKDKRNRVNFVNAFAV